MLIMILDYKFENLRYRIISDPNNFLMPNWIKGPKHCLKSIIFTIFKLWPGNPVAQGTRIEDQRSSLPGEEAVCAPTIPDEDFFSLICRIQVAYSVYRGVFRSQVRGGGGVTGLVYFWERILDVVRWETHCTIDFYSTDNDNKKLTYYPFFYM